MELSEFLPSFLEDSCLGDLRDVFERLGFTEETLRALAYLNSDKKEADVVKMLALDFPQSIRFQAAVKKLQPGKKHNHTHTRPPYLSAIIQVIVCKFLIPIVILLVYSRVTFEFLFCEPNHRVFVWLFVRMNALTYGFGHVLIDFLM